MSLETFSIDKDEQFDLYSRIREYEKAKLNFKDAQQRLKTAAAELKQASLYSSVADATEKSEVDGYADIIAIDLNIKEWTQ